MAEDKDRAARESSIASGWTIEGAQDEAPAPVVEPAGGQADPRAEQEAPETAAQLSSWALIAFGLVGGVYLLYSLVWFSWANHYSQVLGLRAGGVVSIDVVLQQLLFWLAPLAPALWFFSALLLNRGSRRRLTFWLALGLIVLVPLPMFFEASVPGVVGGDSW